VLNSWGDLKAVIGNPITSKFLIFVCKFRTPDLIMGIQGLKKIARKLN
jgi:hypothetical protein